MGFEVCQIWQDQKRKKEMLLLECKRCGFEFETERELYVPIYTYTTFDCPGCKALNNQGSCMESFIERISNEF